jgi:hypothetical protein
MQEKVNSETELSKNKQPSRFFVSLIWGVLAFIVLAAIFAGFSHTTIIDKVLPLRSVGDYHAQFEIKWFKLDEYVKQNGGVDVILLGNSMVNTGIDPETLSTRYEELTGQKLRVFNFGVEGLTVAPLSKVANILEAHYHPGTILLVTDIRDYAKDNGIETETQFLDNAWLQQQLGTKTFKGNLIDSSSAIQRLIVFRNWSSSQFIDSFVTSMVRIGKTDANGYEAETNHGRDIDANPDPNNPQEKAIYEMFANYTMDPSRIRSLQSILELKGQGTSVFVTGFPVYPTYYAYFSKEAQADFSNSITSIVTNSEGTYLPVIDQSLIPFEGRSDNHHLNDKGAQMFSKLLAEQLAAQCKDQGNCLKTSGGQQ